MKTFENTVPIKSELLPGVTAFVLTPTVRRRNRYNLTPAVSAANVKLRDLGDERTALEPECKPHRDAAKKKDCSCSHEAHLHDPDSFVCMVPDCMCRQPDFPPALFAKLVDISKRENDIIYQEIYPAAVLFWVVSIEGLEIKAGDNADPQPATPQLLIENDHDLVDEIAVKINNLLQLSADERKNSARPITSGEQVDGPTINSTARSADETGSIVPDMAATVVSTGS